MELYSFILGNKELIKLFYGIIICLVCAIIVLKTHRLFHISMHQGIRYFRNAFLFYSIAFIIRYFFGAAIFSGYLSSNYFFIIKFLFEFFLIMAGFFLLYSLTWKKAEGNQKSPHSSLFNPRIAIFYLMALILISADYIWQTYLFMFSSQIILFTFALIISYNNYMSNGSRGKFLKFYFVAMLLTLSVWILNALAAFYFNWASGILINIYLINIIVFLLFLWGIITATKK